VDADNIQASFEDGVLTVRIPKSEKARRRKIDVGGNANAQQVGNGESGSGEQQNG
jgi:HSP20 family protein